MTKHKEPRHPNTDEPTNAARAARVDRCIRKYAKDCYGGIDQEEIATIVQDFVTDALHWGMQQEGELGPHDVAFRAAEMALEELKMEAGEPTEPYATEKEN